jgi:hypothetical protein
MCPWTISIMFWWLNAQHDWLSSHVLNKVRSANNIIRYISRHNKLVFEYKHVRLSARNNAKTRIFELENGWLWAANISSGLAHWTVRWCTGQCPVRQAGRRWTDCSRENDWGVRLKFTGLSGGAPDRLVSQRRSRPTVGCAIRGRHVTRSNGR